MLIPICDDLILRLKYEHVWVDSVGVGHVGVDSVGFENKHRKGLIMRCCGEKYRMRVVKLPLSVGGSGHGSDTVQVWYSRCTGKL